MNGPPDVELLDRIAQGDAEAFAGLVRDHGRYLFAVARALVHHDQEAEDVVQETFTAVLTSRFRGESSVRTWLVGIAVKQAALHRRKRGAWLRLVSRPPESMPGLGEQHAVDAKLDLADMLRRLSPEHREVIVLRELEGLSYEQIAQVLGLPRGTVESRLHRARQQLRECFEDSP